MGFYGLFEYPVTVDVHEGVLCFTVNRKDHHQPLFKRFNPRSIADGLEDLSNQNNEPLFQTPEFLKSTLQREIASKGQGDEIFPLLLAKVALNRAVKLSHMSVGRVIGTLVEQKLIAFPDEQAQLLITEALANAISSATEHAAQALETFYDNDAVPNAEAVTATPSSPDEGSSPLFALARRALADVWHTLLDHQLIAECHSHSYIEIVEDTLDQLHKELSGEDSYPEDESPEL